jgi:hypothetical protein
VKPKRDSLRWRREGEGKPDPEVHFFLQGTLRGTIFSRLVILALCKFSGPHEVSAISITYGWRFQFGSGHATAVFVETNPPPGDCNEENTIRFVHDVASDGADCCLVFRKPSDARTEHFQLIAECDSSTTADATGRSKCC